MRRGTLLALVAVLLVGVGCGLSEDSSPQAIAPENLPPDLLDPNPGSSSTVAESADTTSVGVFFLEQIGDQQRLAAVDREVIDPTSPSQRLSALLSQPPDADEGFTTSIPADTMLLEVRQIRADDELILFLSSELFDVEGEELAKAFAQIVYTVTEPEAGGFRRVRFVVDNEPRRALDADLVEQEGAVTRGDYRAWRPDQT